MGLFLLRWLFLLWHAVLLHLRGLFCPLLLVVVLLHPLFLNRRLFRPLFLLTVLLRPLLLLWGSSSCGTRMCRLSEHCNLLVIAEAPSTEIPCVLLASTDSGITFSLPFITLVGGSLNVPATACC
jgi:predicted membrane protein